MEAVINKKFNQPDDLCNMLWCSDLGRDCLTDLKRKKANKKRNIVGVSAGGDTYATKRTRGSIRYMLKLRQKMWRSLVPWCVRVEIKPSVNAYLEKPATKLYKTTPSSCSQWDERDIWTGDKPENDNNLVIIWELKKEDFGWEFHVYTKLTLQSTLGVIIHKSSKSPTPNPVAASKSNKVLRNLRQIVG